MKQYMGNGLHKAEGTRTQGGWAGTAGREQGAEGRGSKWRREGKDIKLLFPRLAATRPDLIAPLSVAYVKDYSCKTTNK